MTSFAVSTSKKWDDASFSSRAGADTYTMTAGAILTIDTDTRTCANSSEGLGVIGNMVITNGQCFVDATAVRLLPYDAGGGTCPAKGTTLYLRSGGVDVASGECLGFWPAINAAPKVHGTDAVPATGYIKFRSLSAAVPDNSDIRTASGGGGSSLGTANGTDVVGWLEIIGNETGATTFTGGASAGLGTFKTRGDWFDVGTTPATPATTDTYQLPASYNHTYYGGVWVETSAGSGVYDIWPSMRDVPANNFATDERGQVCFTSTQGLLRFGYDGTNTGGKLPPAGAKIRVPNIVFCNTTSAATSAYTVGANVTPNATGGTRYELSSNNGKVDCQYMNMGWYFSSLSSPISFLMSYSTELDELSIGTQSPYTVIHDVIGGIGNTDFTPVSGAFYTTSLYGVTMTDCVFSRYSGGRVVMLSASIGGTYTRVKAQKAKARPAIDYGISLDGARNVTFVDPVSIGGYYSFGSNCSDITFTGSKYSDTLNGTVGTSNAHSAFSLTSSNDITIDGLSWVTSTANACQPYTSLMNMDRCKGIKFRNIGTAASPLNVGSTNATGSIISTSGTQIAQNVLASRLYCTDLRTHLVSYGSSTAALLDSQLSNLWGGSTDETRAYKNSQSRGMYGEPNSSIYLHGAHFADGFQSSTAGKIVVLPMAPVSDEPSASSCSITGGAPIFTSSGPYMPALNDQVTWHCPYKIRGYTAFNGAPTFNAGTFANFLVEYSLDRGATWKTASAANLNAETLPSAAVGFWFSVRATTTTANTSTSTNTIDRIIFNMTTTSAAQQNQYALEDITFTDSGSLTGSSVAWINPAGTEVFGFYTKSGTGQKAVYLNEDGTEKTGSYKVRKPGYAEVIGSWTETSSWYNKTKTYYVSQFLAEATSNAAVSGVSVNGATEDMTVAASITLAQLYQHAQYWSALEANMLYDIPVTSAGNGAYTAGYDVTINDGSVLNGSGSLALGANTLSTEFSGGANYTYTGGTWSQLTTTPTFSGGTLALGGTGTYDFTMSSAIITFTPAGAGTYDLSGGTFTGTIDLRNTTAHAISVAVPSGATFITSNNTGGTITVTAPTVNQSVTINGLVAGSRVQIYDTSVTDVELYNGIVAGTSVTWNDPSVATADRDIRVRIAWVSGTSAKEFIEAAAGTCGTTSGTEAVTYLASQTDDDIYNANAVDGSAVTGITIDDTTLLCEVSSGTVTTIGGVNVLEVPIKNVYAYECYWLFTEAGIRDEGKFISAPDVANYRLANFKIKNLSAYPLATTGGYVVEAITGSPVPAYDYSGGAIVAVVPHVVSYQTSGTYAITGDIASIPALVWNYVLEAGLSVGKITRIMASALAGKVSGAGTGTETFKGLDGTTNRIVSSVDSSGNRASVTTDGT